MNEVEKAIKDYKTFLVEAQEQHAKTIADATAQLKALMAAVSTETQPQSPESAWITGNDGEKFLMLNEAAAEVFLDLFSQFKEVIDLFVDQKN